MAVAQAAAMNGDGPAREGAAYNALEAYAMLGDGQSAALVSSAGDIDWLCWPRFDSPPVFARLLGGTAETGHWTIHPSDDRVWTTVRAYLPDTLVLVTTFTTMDASATLTDFLYTHTDSQQRALYRLVQCTSGEITLHTDLRVRFDFGQLRPWIEVDGDELSMRCGAHRVSFLSGRIATASAEDTCVRSTFVLQKGERCAFRLTHRLESEPPSSLPDIDVALAQTTEYWRTWIARLDAACDRWTPAVRRSLLTLKALIYRPTGAMVAASTTSLPEVPGGEANWDYRYSWLRDGSFAMGAFLNAGFREEATAWLQWMIDALGASPDGVRTLYRVDGERSVPERKIAALEGYRFSQPVRAGNAASRQRQVDVLGEVIYCLSLARRAGLEVSARQRAVERLLVDELSRCWHWRDSGMWESRGPLRHYTYSKVMAWKGIRCALEDGLCDQPADEANPSTDESARRQRLVQLCETIHAQVCREAWDAGTRSFTSFYGSRDVDGSLLLLPLVGFLPPDDARIVGTIERVISELGDGGLVRRWKHETPGHGEGAFIACSCWLVDCLRLLGREAEAQERLDAVMSVANDVGLLSEEYDVRSACLAGNFPQALSHLGIVTAALGLSGAVLDPGGG